MGRAEVRFTVLFERLAIDVLQECDVLGASRLLRLSWDETWHLMDRAVTRGLAAKPLTVSARIGVDEKSAGRGQDYITVVCNLDTGTVEHIADERRQASLDGYFERFTVEQRQGIAAVAMDMWEPYINSARQHLDDADNKIVFDRYHIMTYLTTAVDTVRKQENRALAAAGDKSLAGSKYLWLYSVENLPERHRARFTALRAADLKTGRAWAIKESLRHFWQYRRRGWGLRHWRKLVLLGDALAAAAGDRRGAHPQAPRSRPALLLRPPDHQRRCRGPQLTHPGDPSLRTRLPQPAELQDRHLVPLRRTAALPSNPRNSRMSPSSREGHDCHARVPNNPRFRPCTTEASGAH